MFCYVSPFECVCVCYIGRFLISSNSKATTCFFKKSSLMMKKLSVQKKMMKRLHLKHYTYFLVLFLQLKEMVFLTNRLQIHVKRGCDLAFRNSRSSNVYVVIKMGHQVYFNLLILGLECKDLISFSWPFFNNIILQIHFKN